MERLKENIMAYLSKKKINADVYMEENTKTEAAANDGEIEKFTKADLFGLGVRVFNTGKMGTGYCTVKNAKEAEKIIDKAYDAALVEGYGDYKMPGKAPACGTRLADEGFSAADEEILKRSALILEKAAGSDKKVKFVRDTSVTAYYSRINLFNTSGADSYFEKSWFNAYTSAVAVEGGAQEVADASEGSVSFADLDPEILGRDCSARAAGLLKGKSLKSGRYRVIMPPMVAADFAALLSGLFLSNNIRKGKSLLAANNKGDVIGSKILTIRDDALLDLRAGSYPVDGEGSPGMNKAVVENGKLGTFLYDMINARYFKEETTGNSERQDFKSLPDCGPSNFYIQAGGGGTGKETGIYVNSLMGLHMTDTISGNFSLGINGWVMDKGEKKQAVKETLITGNIRDLLMKIDTVYSDLKFYGRFGSPTIAAADVEAAGK